MKEKIFERENNEGEIKITPEAIERIVNDFRKKQERERQIELAKEQIRKKLKEAGLKFTEEMLDESVKNFIREEEIAEKQRRNRNVYKK
jgi:ATP-dependent exoDNAse (exonuclease V) alpha subunit